MRHPAPWPISLAEHDPPPFLRLILFLLGGGDGGQDGEPGCRADGGFGGAKRIPPPD